MCLANDKELDQALYELWVVQKHGIDKPISERFWLSSLMNSYMHKKQLSHCSQEVLVGYGVFVNDMIFVGCICKVKRSQLTQKLLNLSRKS